MEPKRKRPWSRRVLALLLGLVLALLVAEGGLRILLFWDTRALETYAHGLRQPGLYADRRRDNLYWKLQHIWIPLDERRPFGRLSPATGWTGSRIDPVALTLKDEAKVGERRPVLLYGDSFAECVTPTADTWQGLLEKSPEGRTHALLNFGVSGFGTDQTLRMLEGTIERYATRNPLVVFSILLDEDPDRTLLDFRGMPKPRFELVGGELAFRPLQETDAETWWENHPPGVFSYLWRLCRGPAGPLPESWKERLGAVGNDEQVIALNRALITRMHRRLEALHIEHVVLGFQGQVMLDYPDAYGWREDFVRETCRSLGVPYLSSAPYLLAAVGGKRPLLGPSVFFTRGLVEGHYNARGNAVVLEALRQAIHGRYDSEDTSGVEEAMRRFGQHPDLQQTIDLQVLGRPAELVFHGANPSFNLREQSDPQSQRTRALGMFPGREQPTTLAWQIEKDARFVAEAHTVRSGFGDEAQEAVRLCLLVDGKVVRTLELSLASEAVALELQLRAPCTFALRVEPVAGHANSCWVRLDQPKVE